MKILKNIIEEEIKSFIQKQKIISTRLQQSCSADTKSVLVKAGKNVPNDELVHSTLHRNYISEHKIKELAIEKWRWNRKGITFEDVGTTFGIKKSKAQRSLKHFCQRGILFTAENLLKQEIYLLQNRNPQQYFPSCIKADIIEDLKKRKSVLVEPTGVDPPKNSLTADTSEYQKAQRFLDILLLLQFEPLYIHKLLLMLTIDTQFYKDLSHKEGSINRSKSYEENIGKRHVIYTFSPNGTVGIDVRSSDTPFRLETDEDESIIFSFLGQVKDRLLYCIKDVKEYSIPQVTKWVLKACDLNKDVRIDEKAQLTLPDIQLKVASRVFRLYVKSLHDKAVDRSEESLTLNEMLVKEALDNIRHPYKSIENDIKQIKNQVNRIERTVCNVSSEPATIRGNNPYNSCKESGA